MLAGVDAAAWPVFIEERSRERKLGTSVSGRILSAGPGVPSPPPSTYNSASARLQPAAPRHADPSFIKARGLHRRFIVSIAHFSHAGTLRASVATGSSGFSNRERTSELDRCFLGPTSALPLIMQGTLSCLFCSEGVCCPAW